MHEYRMTEATCAAREQGWEALEATSFRSGVKWADDHPAPRIITRADLAEHHVDTRHAGVRSLLASLGIRVE